MRIDNIKYKPGGSLRVGLSGHVFFYRQTNLSGVIYIL